MKVSPEDTKMIEFNQFQKSDRAPFIIYTDLEWIIKKIDGCKNNPENSSTKKQVNIFHYVFQWLQYLHLEANKKSMMYREVKTVWKSFVNS